MKGLEFLLKEEQLQLKMMMVSVTYVTSQSDLACVNVVVTYFNDVVQSHNYQCSTLSASVFTLVMILLLSVTLFLQRLPYVLIIPL